MAKSKVRIKTLGKPMIYISLCSNWMVCLNCRDLTAMLKSGGVARVELRLQLFKGLKVYFEYFLP